MTTTRKSSSNAGGSHRSLEARVLPFVPPYALVGVVVAAGAVAHYVWGGRPVQTALIAVASVIVFAGLTGLTWGIATTAGRNNLVRWHTSATVAAVGVALTLTLIIGLPVGWLSGQIALGVVVAFTWSLRRFDALRHEPSAADAKQGDDLRKQLGLEGVKFGKAKQHNGGDRIEVPFRPGPGQTVADVQSAVPGLETLAGGPPGRSRAVGHPDDASRGVLTLIRKDLLKTGVPWQGPSAPGQCITVPLRTGLYEDGQPVLEYIAGGVAVINHERTEINNTNYGTMGMTRAGKTMHDLIMHTDLLTRRNVIDWWFDKVKGAQTVAPIRAGLDVCVLDENIAAHKAGVAALTRVLNARVRALGERGYRKWTPAAYEDPALRMPYLVAHFEEADALMESMGNKFVYLASKCLSAGISIGVSLQRADAERMPSNVRYNIAAWNCFGVGDDYSAEFALSPSTVDAGAHPENWKANRPGYYYHEGPGIDETRFPVPARTEFTDSDEAMAQVIADWAHVRAEADEVTKAAAGEWYLKVKQQSGQAVSPSPRTPEVVTVTSANTLLTPADGAADTDELDDEEREAREVLADQVAELREDGAIPTQADPEADAEDPGAPIPRVAASADELTWGKEAAPDAATAAEAFDRALRDLSHVDDLRGDDGAVLFNVSEMVERYPFRTRPWFSDRLSKVANGELTIPPGLALERTEKPGHYRLLELATVTSMNSA